MTRYNNLAGLSATSESKYEVNPPRGCGVKVRGASYLEGAIGTKGILGRISWVLGNHWRGGRNVFSSASPRQMEFIDPAATLAELQIVPLGSYRPTSQKAAETYEDLSARIGNFALLDYVGAEYYSPWSFAVETFQYGPSRRVSKNLMLKLADRLPVPVFFCHKSMPIFDTESVAVELTDYASKLVLGPSVRDLESGPTWCQKDWGLSSEDDGGDRHYLIPFLKAMDDWETMLEEHQLAERVSFHETLWMSSWFTRGSYVLKGPEDNGIDHYNVVNINLEED